jgi:hypothetical protein
MPTEAMISSTVASLLHATDAPGNGTIEYISPIYSPFFGVMGIVSSIVFSCKSSCLFTLVKMFEVFLLSRFRRCLWNSQVWIWNSRYEHHAT